MPVPILPVNKAGQGKNLPNVQDGVTSQAGAAQTLQGRRKREQDVLSFIKSQNKR